MIISLSVNYNSLFAEVQFESPTPKERDAEQLAGRCNVFMGPDEFRIVSDRYPDQIVKGSQRGNYVFQRCTKDIRPVDPRGLSREDIAGLMHDPQYMTGPEDYEDLDWDIERAYKELKRAYGSCSYLFRFDGLAYGIRESEKQI